MSRPSRRLVTLQELLERVPVESFDREVGRLVDELVQDDARIVFDLPARAAPNPLARDRFRAEVGTIPVMDRDEEQRYHRVLELLRRRFLVLAEEARLSEDEALELLARGADAELPLEVRGEARRERLGRALRDWATLRNEIVERNLHLVFFLVERYRHVGVPMEDLIQEAGLALFKAVERFDFRRGVRFKTYAAYWINQAFLNAIYDQSRTVRVPAYVQKAMKKLRDAEDQVTDGLRDVEAVAEAAAMDPELARTALRGNRYTSSLNRPASADQEGELVDLLPDSEGEEETPISPEELEALHEHLFEAIAQLPQREQVVLQMRFGLDGRAMATLAEVGEELGVSLERVRQIQAAALDRIRRGRKGETLEQYA